MGETDETQMKRALRRQPFQTVAFSAESSTSFGHFLFFSEDIDPVV